jgi:hypothetical protein
LHWNAQSPSVFASVQFPVIGAKSYCRQIILSVLRGSLLQLSHRVELVSGGGDYQQLMFFSTSRANVISSGRREKTGSAGCSGACMVSPLFPLAHAFTIRKKSPRRSDRSNQRKLPVFVFRLSKSGSNLLPFASHLCQHVLIFVLRHAVVSADRSRQQSGIKLAGGVLEHDFLSQPTQQRVSAHLACRTRQRLVLVDPSYCVVVPFVTHHTSPHCFLSRRRNEDGLFHYSVFPPPTGGGGEYFIFAPTTTADSMRLSCL